MNVDLIMPDLSTSGSTVRVSQWLVKPGQTVKQGQPLMEVETDKATMEVESYLAGTLLEIVVPDDTEVEVGQVIAVVEVRQESLPAEKPSAETTNHHSPEIVGDLGDLQPSQMPHRSGMFSRNRQRITEPNMSVASQITLTGPQRVVGQRMLLSKQTAPHFYLQTSANANAIIQQRSSVEGKKLVVDAFFLRAAARALEKYPRMKLVFQENQLVSSPTDAIGVAIDHEGDLFVVPISAPGTKSVDEISGDIRHWIGLLQAGDGQARKLNPTCFTISNLGASGIESFTAIINPPEAAILAIGKIGPVPVVAEDQIVIQNRVTLVLSIDHRVANGRYAADFLQTLVSELEEL